MNNEKIRGLSIQQVSKRYGAILVLLFLLIINSLFTKNFLHINTMWNILLQAFPVIIISMGMALVIGTGGIDISVGSTMAISSIVLAKLSIMDERSIAIGLLMALFAAFLFGLFNGILVGVLKFQPIVATLILMIAGRGIAQQFNDGTVISFYGNKYTELGSLRIGGVLPVQVVMLVIVFGIMLFIAKKTTFGKYLQATGENIETSRLSGVNTVAVIIAAYVICAVLAGAASIMETLRICAADPNNIGQSIELDCVAAVAVGGASMSGGTVRLGGTVTGAIVMQLITTMVNMNNINYSYSLVIKAVIIIVALYLQREKN